MSPQNLYTYYLARSFGGKRHLFVRVDRPGDEPYMLPCCSCPGSSKGSMRETGAQPINLHDQHRNVCLRGMAIIKALRLRYPEEES